MAEMIERVARAICEANGNNPDGKDSQGCTWWVAYEPEARAALLALRDPPPVYVDDLMSIPCGYRCEMEGGYSNAVEAWNDAIDSILAESVS